MNEQQQLTAQQTQAYLQSQTQAQLIQQQLIQQQKRLQQHQLAKSNITPLQNRSTQPTQQQQQYQQQYQQQSFPQKHHSFPSSNTPSTKRSAPSYSDALGPNTALLRAKRARPTDRSLPVFEPADPKAPRYSLGGLKPERINNIHQMAKNYARLQKVEQEFDWLISRKRFEIEDILRKPNPVQRTLRIKVWNTTSNQAWQQNQASAKNPPHSKRNDKNSQANQDQDANRDGEDDHDENDDHDRGEDKDREKNEDEGKDQEQNPKETAASASGQLNFASGEGIPKWTLHLEGHLLDSNHPTSPPTTREDGMTGVESAQSSPLEVKIEETPRPLSTLLNSVIVKIDRPNELYAEPNIIEWHRSTGGPTFSAISITRNGSEDCSVQIALHLNHFPQRFKLNPSLGSFLDIKEGSLDEIFEAIWCYIKRNKLIDTGVDKRLIRKDSNLACLFPPSIDRMPFHQLSEQMKKFLSIPEPAIIPFEVRVDKDQESGAEYFDIQMSIEDPAKLHLLNIKNQIEDCNLTSHNNHSSQSPQSPVNFTREILALDEQIMDCIAKIREVKIRRDFYKKFTMDPIRFIEEWIESQSKDLEVLFGVDRGTEGTSVNAEMLKGGVSTGGKDLGLSIEDGGMMMGLDYQKRFSNFYNRKWVEDAIKIYQAREFNQKVHQHQGGGKSMNNQIMMNNNHHQMGLMNHSNPSITHLSPPVTHLVHPHASISSNSSVPLSHNHHNPNLIVGNGSNIHLRSNNK